MNDDHKLRIFLAVEDSLDSSKIGRLPISVTGYPWARISLRRVSGKTAAGGSGGQPLLKERAGDFSRLRLKLVVNYYQTLG